MSEAMHNEIARLYCAGSTTRPEKVKVLWVSESGKTALVKHPGAKIGSPPLVEWVPSWIDRLDVETFRSGKRSKQCVMEVTKDNRLTKARLAELIAEAQAAEEAR